MLSKRQEILEAGLVAVDELIKILREPIVTNTEDDISADKLKNAAASKRLAFDDALAILSKIESEREASEELKKESKEVPITFAENRAKGKEKRS